MVEVGWGKKGSRQVIKTMKKTGISCGIVVYDGPLKRKGEVWFLPRELFLLML